MRIIEGHNVKIFTDNLEENALAQIRELLSIEVFADRKIRIMPDVHAGAGCVIGFTGDLGDKVIPNIVGVDIGCGMRVVSLGRVGEVDYHAFNEHIVANIPSGTWVREEKHGFRPLTGEAIDLYREAKQLVMQLRCYRELKNTDRIYKSASRRNELQAVIKQMRREYKAPEPSVPRDLCYVEGESPMVYKPASEIITNIGDTVSIDTIIKPVFNFKASK